MHDWKIPVCRNRCRIINGHLWGLLQTRDGRRIVEIQAPPDYHSSMWQRHEIRLGCNSIHCKQRWSEHSFLQNKTVMIKCFICVLRSLFYKNNENELRPGFYAKASITIYAFLILSILYIYQWKVHQNFLYGFWPPYGLYPVWYGFPYVFP